MHKFWFTDLKCFPNMVSEQAVENVEGKLKDTLKLAAVYYIKYSPVCRPILIWSLAPGIWGTVNDLSTPLSRSRAQLATSVT